MSDDGWNDGYPTQADVAVVMGPPKKRQGPFRRYLNKRVAETVVCTRHGGSERVTRWQWKRIASSEVFQLDAIPAEVTKEIGGWVILAVALTERGCRVVYSIDRVQGFINQRGLQ